MASKTSFSREPQASNQAGYHDKLLARLMIGSLVGFACRLMPIKPPPTHRIAFTASLLNHGKASPAPPVPGARVKLYGPIPTLSPTSYVAFATRLTRVGVLAVHHRTISPQTPESSTPRLLYCPALLPPRPCHGLFHENGALAGVQRRLRFVRMRVAKDSWTATGQTLHACSLHLSKSEAVASARCNLVRERGIWYKRSCDALS